MKSQLIYMYLLFISSSIFGQNKEFTSIEEALENPEMVFRLNLNNQTIKLTDEEWQKFVNLEYLSLKNDQLKELPRGIGKLKTLKTLDLSGNNFKTLPNNFTKLVNLEELYLNDEKNLNLAKTLKMLAKLPKLKSLHLENDNIEALPKEILRFKNLEHLYLNDNILKKIPQVETLNHLKYLDLKNNNIKPELQDMKNLNFGFKINFN